MAIPATQMRPGMIIKHNNDLHSVFSVEHRTPGNLRAFIQAKLRNIRTGAMFEHRFLPGRRQLLLHEHGKLRAGAPEP
jgi:elongation factor P